MRPTTVTVTGIGVSTPIVMERGTAPSNASVGVKISATATYTVEYTYDDVFASTFTPAGATWFPLAAMSAKTANADGNFAFPPMACRLNVSASTGTATMVLITAGIA